MCTLNFIWLQIFLARDDDKWLMSFVMPSKYGSSLPFPKDPSVAIKEVPSKIVAVAAFLGIP